MGMGIINAPDPMVITRFVIFWLTPSPPLWLVTLYINSPLSAEVLPWEKIYLRVRGINYTHAHLIYACIGGKLLPGLHATITS